MAPMDLPPGHGADPTSGVHPHEIPLRPFSRVLFGLSPTEVRQFLQEVAQALERATTELNNAVIERRVLESSLKEYQSRLEQLEQDLAAYREREAQIPRALVDAERAAEDVTRAARAEADRILHEARRTAEETLRAARESAVQALREARLSAEHLIQASRRAAAEHEREARLEAQWLMDEAQRVVSDLRQRAEEFLGRWREATTHLDRLASEYAEAAHTVARLRTEAQDLLPRMEEMLQNLTAKVPVPGPRPPAARAAEPAAPPPPREEPTAAVAPPEVPLAPATGEIIAYPFRSYLRMTKFLTALGRLPGVVAARALTFADEVLRVEVQLAHGSLADLDLSRLEGFRVTVEEAAPTWLKVQVVEERANSALAG
jgi:cell division septum initiation protein DivIVA